MPYTLLLFVFQAEMNKNNFQEEELYIIIEPHLNVVTPRKLHLKTNDPVSHGRLIEFHLDVTKFGERGAARQKGKMKNRNKTRNWK